MSHHLRTIAILLLALSTSAMAYDLHITKASDWSESPKTPITEDQWKGAVRADGELQIDEVATTANPKTKEVIQINNPLMASWVDPQTRLKHYFYYSRGKITVKNPTDRVIAKMKAIASKLGAKVQGDEGELY